MVDYELTRNERRTKQNKKGDEEIERFICIEVYDDKGSYNYGKWLPPSDVAAIEKDPDAITAIVEKYANRARRPEPVVEFEREFEPVEEE